MANEEEVLIVEVVNRVSVLTLNRPERRNALNRSLERGIRHAVARFEEDPDSDVMVVTGAGPAFCAGVDLKSLGTDESPVTDRRELNDSAVRGPFGAHAKPIIGAVNGPAVTGGLEVALACDYLIASERATFADTHARVGLMPFWGLTVLLPEAIGVRRAREMSTTGNFVSADVALTWGMVNRVVAHELLMPTCLEIAAAVVSNDQQAVQSLLASYARCMFVTEKPHWEIEAEVSRNWSRKRKVFSESTAHYESVIERGRSQVPGSSASEIAQAQTQGGAAQVAQ